MDDLLSQNFPSSPWIWDPEREDHYVREYDWELRHWTTIWKHGSDSKKGSSKDVLKDDSDSNSHIVKAGAEYTQSVNSHKAWVDAFATQKRTLGQPQKFQMDTKTNKVLLDNLVYQPLTGHQDMRVLELHAGRFEDELNCSLHVCCVDFEYPEDPETKWRPNTLHAMSCITCTPVWYTALSYVWGDPALVSTINCNGKPFAITKNLELALRHLRNSNVSILLWVDQLCINQDDFQEKSQQVVLMQTIYKRAWSTLVWLGEEADNSSDALDTLLATKDALQYYPDGKSPDVGDFERLFLPASDSPKWLELGKLMSRPWFQRIWIIQEVVLSHQIIIMCGAKCISWEDFGLFTFCMIDNDFERYLYGPGGPRGEDDNSESGCVRARKINRIKDYNDTSIRKTTFLDGLVEGRSAGATDPRDKVFAVMGMTSVVMYPDYSNNIIDVYTEAALRVETTSELGSLLCCVDHAQPAPNQPSWVPDWATPRQTVSLGYNAKHQKVYQASREREMQSRTEITETGAALAITGVVVDTITTVGMVLEVPDLKDILVLESLTSRFILEAMDIALEHCRPHPSSNRTVFEAFWQTLVAGRDHSKLAKAPDEYAPIFALLFDTATGSTPSFPDQPALPTARRPTLENLQARNPARTYRHMQVAMEAAVKLRRLGATAKRHLGLFPRGTTIGDRVCVFAGACVPFVMRRVGTGDGYRLVGECYVHGVMDGEGEDVSGGQKREILLR